MTADPFAYLRGAAAVMAHDLQYQPMAGVPVQACGDCHLMNFGAFVTPEDNILFDINDFDETLPGVDFHRRSQAPRGQRRRRGGGAGRVESRRAATRRRAVRAYRKHMIGLSQMSPLEIWHSRDRSRRSRSKKFADADLRKKDAGRDRRARAAKASTATTIFRHSAQSGAPRIADKPPRIFHFPPDSDAANGIRSGKRLRQLSRRALTPDGRRCSTTATR